MGLAYIFLLIMILGVTANRGSGCFFGSGMENLEKIPFENLCNHPCAFGCALRCCSILFHGNRLERAALGISFLTG